jgi:DNA-binding GntR family transcriptional regulator
MDHSGTSADRIAAILRDRIITGAIPAGPLRQERIADEFGLSHVPVREAFRRLEAQGLVLAEPRRGVSVPPLDPAALREIVDMRLALEPLGLRHAAPRLRAEHMKEIETALVAGETADSIIAWEDANRAFHRALVAACGMKRLMATLDALQLASSRYVLAGARAAGWQPRSNNDHRQIADALKARDVERASALLAKHIGTMERIAPAA